MQGLTFLILIGLMTLNFGCSNNSDQKKLGEAQACLDKVPQSDPTSAASCYSYISSVNSPQADSLRCAIGFLTGGVTTSKLVDAVKQISDGGSSEEVFISILVFNGIDPDNTTANATGTQALANVNRTAAYCNASGVKGLMYLGNFAVAGTALVKSFMNASGDSFWRDPKTTDFQAQIAGGLSDCADGTKVCDPTDVGNAILVLGDSYCATKKDDQQCQQVQEAINNGGGSPENIGTAFYQQLFCSKDENKNNPPCN
ncbi:MAG: hypothetical protein H6625_02030 [Bdellovibrionaceae bacterium]|nr:hypothetical protein [Pseudobdellovibrionaceae bacterium]